VLEILDFGLGCHSARHFAQNPLHHSEVFSVVVGLEQGDTESELEDDAADTPDVAGLAPAELQDDFWSSVVAGGDYRTVVLVVEGGAAEVDEADGGVLDILDVVAAALVVRVEEQDILWFEIGVSDSVFVKEVAAVAELVGHLAHVLEGVGLVVIVFEEVENTFTEDFEGDTHVSVKVEPVHHPHALVLSGGVVLGELSQHVDLKLGSLTVLFHVFDDF